MTAEEQKRQINYLVERLNAADLKKRAMDLVLQDFLDKQKEYDEFANKNRFGDKSHRTKKKDSEEESDRTKDKDDFDGTSLSLPENLVL